MSQPNRFGREKLDKACFVSLRQVVRFGGWAFHENGVDGQAQNTAAALVITKKGAGGRIGVLVGPPGFEPGTNRL